MDGGQLHRLGRRLIELSAQVTGEAGDLSLTPGEAAVLEAVIRNPDSSITDIHRHTGFVQSHVSASVSRLKARALVEVVSDPSDARRTRVRISEAALHAITRRASRQADQVLGDAIGDPAREKRINELIDELAGLLMSEEPNGQ